MRARELFQLLEQIRLEACIRRAFPGLARQMDRLSNASSTAIEKTRTLAAPLLTPNATVQDTLALLEDLYEDNPKLPPAPPWAGEIDIARAEENKRGPGGARNPTVGESHFGVTRLES